MNADTPRGAPVRRVVIAGGGTAGWMVAALLGRSLGRTHDITLVESDEIGTVGVGEATIPTLLLFHDLLGIKEQEFMAATLATFKLGIGFEHWRVPGHRYIHSFGLTGRDHWTAGFQHFWLKGLRRGLASPEYGDYCTEHLAARQGRFAHLPKAGMNYAYHLDASRYARFLRAFSEPLRVKRVEGRIVEVLTHGTGPDAAHIRALRLDSGVEIPGDLFIDCTGFRALLIGATMGAGFEDWSAWLPCDSAVAVQTASVGEAIPYTRSIAHDCGWQWRIPLQHRVGNGMVYSARHLDDEAARAALLERVQGEVLAPPRVIKFRPGQRTEAWRGNCVAIGLAGGFVEPLESTSIHLIQRGAIKLMQMLPSEGIAAADVAEYNRQTRWEMEHVRDFIVLHYHVTQRDDTGFWRDCRAMDIPASLRHRIELFRETGRVFRAPDELFAENSWIQVMLGQGILPHRHHPSADLMGDDELKHFLAGIQAGVQRTVNGLPRHEAYVRQYCGAAAAAAGGDAPELALQAR
jgi:tryptophan halogenase